MTHSHASTQNFVKALHLREWWQGLSENSIREGKWSGLCLAVTAHSRWKPAMDTNPSLSPLYFSLYFWESKRNSHNACQNTPRWYECIRPSYKFPASSFTSLLAYKSHHGNCSVYSSRAFHMTMDILIHLANPNHVFPIVINTCPAWMFKLRTVELITHVIFCLCVYLSSVYTYVYMCMGTYVPSCTCEHHRITFRGQFCPSTV